MMEKMKTMLDVVPMGGQWFISSLPMSAPWRTDATVDVAKVDTMYMFGHSGGKLISPFVEHFLVDGKLTQANVTEIANVLWQIYGEGWSRLWEINKLEYDPIENYNGVETVTTTESGKEIFDRTHTGEDTTTTSGNASDNKAVGKVYGFNSTSPVNDSEQETSHKSSTTFTPGVADKEEKSFDERTTVVETRKAGNLGVTTSQQMASSSIEFWKWKFWQNVFSDIDEYLTLSVY